MGHKMMNFFIFCNIIASMLGFGAIIFAFVLYLMTSDTSYVLKMVYYSINTIFVLCIIAFLLKKPKK